MSKMFRWITVLSLALTLTLAGSAAEELPPVPVPDLLILEPDYVKPQT